MEFHKDDLDLIVFSQSKEYVGTIARKSSISILANQIGTDAPKGLKQPVEQTTNQIFDYAPWGAGNNMPAKYDQLIKENSVLSGAIQKKLDKLFAGGIEYGYLDAQRNFNPTYIPEIEEFIEQPQVQQYLVDSWENLLKKGNVMPQVAFNALKTKLLWFKSITANEIRYAYQNPDNGVIEKAFWSKDWHLSVGRANTIELPVIDELFHNFKYITDNQKDFFYIYKTPIPGPNTYYQDPPWYSVVLHGWYKQSMQVPAWYIALMENSSSLQYEIEFDEKYFVNLYGEKWTSGTKEQKRTYMAEALKHVSDMIKGVGNAGKNVAKLKFYDKTRQMEVSAYTITALTGKTFSGEFIKNLQEADQHIMWAVGLDPIELGKSGDNSGSAKKGAFNADMSTNERIATIILSVFYFWKRFNKLDPKLKFRIRVPFIGDLNQTTPSQRNNQYPDNANSN